MTPRGVGCLPPRPLALHPCSDIMHNIASASEPAELESRSERGDRPAASARGGVLPRPGWFARARGVARLGGTGTTPAWSESGRRPASSVASRPALGVGRCPPACAAAPPGAGAAGRPASWPASERRQSEPRGPKPAPSSDASQMAAVPKDRRVGALTARGTAAEGSPVMFAASEGANRRTDGPASSRDAMASMTVF